MTECVNQNGNICLNFSFDVAGWFRFMNVSNVKNFGCPANNFYIWKSIEIICFFEKFVYNKYLTVKKCYKKWQTFKFCKYKFGDQFRNVRWMTLLDISCNSLFHMSCVDNLFNSKQSDAKLSVKLYWNAKAHTQSKSFLYLIQFRRHAPRKCRCKWKIRYQ